MRGLINLHIVCVLLHQSTPGRDRNIFDPPLGFGLAPELAQVGLLRECWLGSFGHLQESTWERINDEDSGLYRRISYQGSIGESYNEEYAPGHETSHAN